jgi:hypothetical protein
MIPSATNGKEAKLSDVVRRQVGHLILVAFCALDVQGGVSAAVPLISMMLLLPKYLTFHSLGC